MADLSGGHGCEWVIEALGCDIERLKNVEQLRTDFADLSGGLSLHPVSETQWHQFPGAGGITGLCLLAESHLACHTYPEYETATFNLYCCKLRPEWNWEANLKKLIDAKTVKITKIKRGNEQSQTVGGKI